MSTSLLMQAMKSLFASSPIPARRTNTVCDQSYWGEPTLFSGEQSKPESDPERLARRQRAIDQARNALQGKPSVWSWKLESSAGITGASIVPGPSGLADAFIAFADDRRELVFNGFTMQVDGESVGADLPCTKVDSRFDGGNGSLTMTVPHGDQSLSSAS